MKRYFVYFTFAFLCISQLVVFCSSFIAFTTPIKIFPWYDTDALGAFFGLIFLIPIQCVLSLYWAMYEEIFIPKLIKIISFISLGTLISFISLTGMQAKLFQQFSVPFATLECLLMTFLLFSSIRWFIEKQYN